MKNMIKLLLVSVAVFAFTGTSLAQGTTPAPAKPAAPAKTTEKKEVTVKVKSARGELLAVDSKAGTAKIKGKDEDMNLVADAKETKNALAKIKAGDTVRVTYVDKDGKLSLRSVSKIKAKTSSKSSAKKEETKPAK